MGWVSLESCLYGAAQSSNALGALGGAVRMFTDFDCVIVGGCRRAVKKDVTGVILG